MYMNKHTVPPNAKFSVQHTGGVRITKGKELGPRQALLGSRVGAPRHCLPPKTGDYECAKCSTRPQPLQHLNACLPAAPEPPPSSDGQRSCRPAETTQKLQLQPVLT